MSRLQNLEQNVDPLNDGPTADNIPTGLNAVALQYSYKGTSDSAEALISEDLGQVVIDIYGRQQINVPIGFFHHWARIHRGTVPQTTPTAGSTRLDGIVPFHYAGAPQALPVLSEGGGAGIEYSFQHNASALDTVFDQGAETPEFRLEVISLENLGPSYIPKFVDEELQFNGAATLEPSFRETDYAHVYVREKASNNNSDIVKQIQATVDSRQVARNQTDETIRTESIYLEGTESPTGPWAHKSLMEGGDPSNADVQLDIETNNAGDVVVVKNRVVSLEAAGVADLF